MFDAILSLLRGERPTTPQRLLGPAHPAYAREITELRADVLAKEEQLQSFASLLRQTEEVLADRTRQLQRERANREESRQSAQIEVLSQLIEPLEDLRRVIKTPLHPQLKATPWPKGMELAYNKLIRALAALGVATFGRIDESFDPTRHEAVGVAYRTDITEGMITEVYQPGYKFRGRVIVYAKVCVATHTTIQPYIVEQTA